VTRRTISPARTPVRQRVRTAQAFATITDPLGLLTDIPRTRRAPNRSRGARALLEPTG